MFPAASNRLCACHSDQRRPLKAQPAFQGQPRLYLCEQGLYFQLFCKQIHKHPRTWGQLLPSCTLMNLDRPSKVCEFGFEGEAPPTVRPVGHCSKGRAAQLSRVPCAEQAWGRLTRPPRCVLQPLCSHCLLLVIFPSQELAISASAVCVFD